MKIKNKNNKGITLISLVITIIVLIILAGVSISLIIGNNEIFNKTQIASEEYNKQSATEIINLKITNVQILKYAEQHRLPTLKELADTFCNDDDFQYVQETSKVASLPLINNENPKSIYTKLKAYPYEFEINSSLQLASIDGVKIANNSENSNDVIDYGIATIPSGSGWRYVYVKFNKKYTSNPIVVTQPMQYNMVMTDGGDNAMGGVTQWEVNNVTTDGFYIWLYNNQIQSDINLYWIAIGK